jgi:hypothetical protein
MDNFDLRKYLVENKATTNSRMLNEADDAIIPAIKETAALLKQEGIPFEMVSFQDMEADLQHGMDVEGDTSKGVIKLDSKKGTIYIAEYGYNSISISGKNVEDEDDYVTNSPEEMVQVLKQDFLNESSETMNEAETTFTLTYNTDPDDLKYVESMLSKKGISAKVSQGTFDEDVEITVDVEDLEAAKEALEDAGFDV